MIHRMYSIYDQAAKAFLPPITVRSDGQALRAFADCVNSKNHQFSEHPEDYAVYFLGEWCDSSAEFIASHPGPKNIGSGLSVKKYQASDQGDLLASAEVGSAIKSMNGVDNAAV